MNGQKKMTGKYYSAIDTDKMIPVEKGWSGDEKYCVTLKNGEKYLLRISPAEQYDMIKRNFEVMKKIEEQDVPMCRPVEYGVCGRGVYSLQTWIDGRDMEDALSSLSDEEIYQYALESGRILKKIHSVPAPDNAEKWEVSFSRKIDRKIGMYSDCPLKYENGEPFLDCISRSRHLLKDRPQTCQHGDYHIGNMMLGGDGRLYIIDFNRDDHGDPWEEFNRIVWCAQASPLFASGMVNGYFDGNVPMLFWQLLALYISSNALSSLPWAIPFGEAEINTMRKQAAEILEWYDDMKTVVPKWYIK